MDQESEEAQQLIAKLLSNIFLHKLLCFETNKN
jgi:hypothetical protein